MPKFGLVKVLCERCFTQAYATKFFIILVKGKNNSSGMYSAGSQRLLLSKELQKYLEHNVSLLGLS